MKADIEALRMGSIRQLRPCSIYEYFSRAVELSIIAIDAVGAALITRTLFL